MADASQDRVDKKVKKIEQQINAIYGQAQVEIEQKLKDFEESYKVKKDIYYQMYKRHEITQTDYNSWRAGQLFQMEQWKAKRDQICGVLHSANAQAVKIVNGGTVSAFAEGANWTAYSLEYGAGAVFGFGLYDAQTVTSLIVDDPQVLPKWKIDEPKEYIWNKQKVNNCVTQGIIQGEGIQDITKRIATVTCNQNKNLALTHARTAMTAAQNAGRAQRLQDAKKLGINVVKEWMATLDGRTRDSHRDMDREQRPVGDQWHPMKFSNGCRFPGDPQGPAHEVFNCRCTLVGDLLDYPEEYERYDNIDGVPVKGMTYREWEKAKGVGKQTKINEKKAKAVKKKLDAKVKEVEKMKERIEMEGADYEFANIWKSGTKTYADWESVKDSIPSKIEYYENHKKSLLKRLLNGIGIDDDEIDEDMIKGVEDELMPFLRKYISHLSQVPNWDDLPQETAKMLESWEIEDRRDIIDLLTTYHEVINKYGTDDLYIKQLNMFMRYGDEYSKLLADYKTLQGELAALSAEYKALTWTGPFEAEAYSQARKDAALWARTAREADKALRPVTGEVWRAANTGEKHAAYNYTAGSGKFNRPLRGYDGSWYHYEGVGQVPLDNESGEKDIKLLTGMIKKSHLAQDTWLQRGVDTSGLAGFLGVPEDTLRRASQEELEQLLIGREVTDTAFFSCGSSKGSGFSGNILNIYCPEGTEALYVEPFSAFGHGSLGWNGVSDASSFGHELETIVQRNTTFRITKVERSGGKIYLDIEVVDQNPDDFSPWD